jgi:hypothetical protein
MLRNLIYYNIFKKGHIKEILTYRIQLMALNLRLYIQKTLKSQFSHKQLVLVSGPGFYRGFFCPFSKKARKKGEKTIFFLF